MKQKERIITNRMALESQKTDDRLLLYRKNDEDIANEKLMDKKRFEDNRVFSKDFVSTRSTKKEFTEDYITIDSRSRDVDYWINSTVYSINFQSTQGGANLQERFKNIKEISIQSSTIGYNASKEQSEPFIN